LVNSPCPETFAIAHVQNVLDERKIAHVSDVILYAITRAENAF